MTVRTYAWQDINDLGISPRVDLEEGALLHTAIANPPLFGRSMEMAQPN